jgi:integrase
MGTVLHVQPDYGPGPQPLEHVIDHWLTTKRGLSGSERTRRAYHDTLASFRAHLRDLGRDLDSDEEIISTQAQAWAALGAPAPATYNQRITIVSSFYRHCRKHRLLPPGCAEDLNRVDRRKVQAYAEAQPLTPDDARAALARIDRTTLAGLRDYALLLLALTTGRRVAEIAALRRGDLHIKGHTITVTFRRCKGGKTMRDTLSEATTAALLAWLQAFYEQAPKTMPTDAPIFVSLARGSRGKPLSVTAMKRFCEEHMGCHFHTLRHTFARAMEDAGAKVSDIQARLGHESLDTTGRYLAALKRNENPLAPALDRMFV